MRTINHSSTVINPRGPVVACCFVWNLLVRTMRPSFSGEASLGLAQGNREEGLLSKEARLAVLFEEHVRREACMAQSRLTPSRTPTQPSSLVAEAAIPYQGRDSRRSTFGQNMVTEMGERHPAVIRRYLQTLGVEHIIPFSRLQAVASGTAKTTQ